jgi:alkylmercury lyase-like protein
MDTQATQNDPDGPRCSSGIDAFDAAWREVDERLRGLIDVTYGLIGLSRLGERPVDVTRFAAYLDLSVDDALAQLAKQSGVLFTPRVHDGLITLDLDRPDSLQRRHLRIGERRIAMSGCAPDLFQIAAVLDTPFQVEDTCSTTGVPIRVTFAPPDQHADLIAAVDPADTVVALDPRLLGQTATMTPEQIDNTLCVQPPFFANPDAARDWLATHPTGHTCPVRQLARLELIGYLRDVVRPRVAVHDAGRHGPTAARSAGSAAWPTGRSRSAR